MIDPILSLSFGMYSIKGAYALLLGSGVSRSAGIPTGWEVVLDLIRKVARLSGQDCEPDPAAWYKATFGAEPGYSSLLDQLAGSPAERNRLLRSCFEPSADEREQGLKLPTAAHKAIAELVAAGFVRVIVTTNFDRLIEQALEAIGISPTVISTPDAADGALPVVHTSCTVIKVHGDYLDTRIKNSPAELAEYDPRIDRLLDRVFDEFGLIVCGWSAEWDAASEASWNAVPIIASRPSGRREVTRRTTPNTSFRCGVPRSLRFRAPMPSSRSWLKRPPLWPISTNHIRCRRKSRSPH